MPSPPDARPSTSETSTPPRAIAFYLPQFHPTPENDEWWGTGFTEWTNVVRARPRFRGHQQPRLPADLGFYDLRLPEAREAQVEMARRYGVHGFCYYHYWFNGRRFLHRPLDDVLALGAPDFPFCVCWANENLTRRWDGSEHHILLGQSYSAEDDLRHIEHLLPILADPRYIRVLGRPLLLVYRTELLPDPARTAERWRTAAIRSGLGDLYLARVDGFVEQDPRSIGFDAAVEFAPTARSLPGSGHRTLRSRIAARLERYFPRPPRDEIIRYADLVTHMLAQPAAAYPRFRCACPSWDHSPRRRTTWARIFTGASPQLYESWLRELVAQRQDLGGEFAPVFINSWNEWAEGANLEPCSLFGHGFLEATRAALAPGNVR